MLRSAAPSPSAATRAATAMSYAVRTPAPVSMTAISGGPPEPISATASGVAFGSTIASSSRPAIASRSASHNPVSGAFTRTTRAAPPSVGRRSAIVERAACFRSGATVSSRSATTASAPDANAARSSSGSSAATNSRDRKGTVMASSD